MTVDSARHHAGVSEALLSQALETISEGSLITDADRNTIFANRAFTAITGYLFDEILETNCRFLQGPLTSPETVQQIRIALDSGTVFQGTILNYRKDGSTFWNHLTITPLHDEAGRVTNFASVQRDVTDSVEERERLSYQASHDVLTGLPNREGARRLLRRALASADASGNVVAVGLLDLDYFKTINDEHGHPVGDTVLTELGRRIRTALRRDDHVTRAGGDEFVLIVADLDPERAEKQFDDVARRLYDAVVRPIRLDNGAEITITISLGVALYPNDGVDAKSLYAAADRALYRSKENRGSDKWYTLANPPRPTGLEAQAVTDGTKVDPSFAHPGAPAHHTEGTLTMFMQPIVDLQSGHVTQFEALARIRRPDGSVMLPDEFLPQYTSAHLREVFWIGINNALDWVARWQELGHELSVSVNAPPELFSAPDGAQLVMDALELTGVDPGRLSLELLESREIELSASNEAIDKLVRLGVKLHLDDISSGYSTLKRVTELPFDVIKIDRHIFDNVRTRALHVITVLAAIIKLGADFGYGVTVEGIETQERLEVSAALGAHFGQGFLFARPMPPEDVVAWLESGSLTVRPDIITTALGALAYHWTRTRETGARHPSREQCPLTAYFSREDSQVIELHDRLHDSEGAGTEAATLITSWLMDAVSGRH